MRTSNNYILTIPMTTESEVIGIREQLKSVFGWVRLRGRHSNRKSVLGNKWRPTAQNDIPWQQAEHIDIYIHPNNPNYTYWRGNIFYKDGVVYQSIFGSKFEVNQKGELVYRSISKEPPFEVIRNERHTFQLHLN